MDTIHNKKIMQGPTPKVFVRGEALVRQSCTKASPLTKRFSGEAAVYGGVHKKVQRRSRCVRGCCPHGFLPIPAAVVGGLTR